MGEKGGGGRGGGGRAWKKKKRRRGQRLTSLTAMIVDAGGGGRWKWFRSAKTHLLFQVIQMLITLPGWLSSAIRNLWRFLLGTFGFRDCPEFGIYRLRWRVLTLTPFVQKRRMRYIFSSPKDTRTKGPTEHLCRVAIPKIRLVQAGKYPFILGSHCRKKIF